MFGWNVRVRPQEAQGSHYCASPPCEGQIQSERKGSRLASKGHMVQTVRLTWGLFMWCGDYDFRFMSKWSVLFTQAWKEDLHSTLIGVGLVCTPSVKVIRILEAD